ncbi:MAG: DUF1553 domain-containing protein [Planctomycetia bacterium]|nr:DUF1553 domain-containing protein [Planctomycetia bacterium]
MPRPLATIVLKTIVLKAVILHVCILASVMAAAGTLHAADAPPTAPVDYQRQIRPILSNSCYTCHGPDEKHREAKLRLDVRDAALKKAIQPGHADKSALIERVTSEDADERMPPHDSGRAPLTPAQVELLKRWINEGAKYTTHWAYVSITRPEVPSITSPGWDRSEIDRFVLRRLVQEKLTPATEADRRTLIRRLSFDLVGLPPTPAEVEAFVADKSPDAYENLVDRLLASPHFGERMAVDWLDLVRYADSEGFHGDQERPHWLFRDYVIRSFNENKPFNQFTIEQLAGDLLPKPTYWQRIASGYNRLGMTTAEGGAQPKEYMAKYASDRVRNASTVWLGSTFGCAECHDHKFDPYLTRDFYRFEAFFADIDEIVVGHQEPTVMVSVENQKQLDQINAEIAATNKLLATPTDELAKAQREWEKRAAPQLPEWQALMPTSITTKSGSALRILEDGTLMGLNEGPETDTYTVAIKTKIAGINALRLEAISDPTFPDSGPGRSDFGEFILNEIQVQLGAPKSESDKEGEKVKPDGTKPDGTKPKADDKKPGPAKPAAVKPTVAAKPQPPVKFKLSQATADFSRKEAPASAAIDGDPKTGWDIYHVAGKDHAIEFRVDPPLGKAGQEAEFSVVLVQEAGSRKTLGKFKLFASATPRTARGIGAHAIPQEIVDLLRVDDSKRNEYQRGAVAAYYRSIAPTLDGARVKLQEIKNRREKLLKSGEPILVTSSVKPHVTRVLPRGNWLDETGEVLTPGVPDFLKPLSASDRRATRLDLAQWMVDPANPLVARVYVNRLWKQMFGRGLVSTADDFGSQGAAPSHPELLDFLAADFVQNGWDTKRLLKLIAMSATYRQTSRASDELLHRDPANILLARQGRFRLPAEHVRDNALAVSGLLVPKIGGPSVKPYQPAGYYAHLNFPKREYQQDHGEALYRRGLYTHWQRTFLHPSLLAFDAPSREECTVDRTRSNTPLAALVMLNDPTYVEAARVMAAHAMHDGGTTPADRVRYLMQQSLQRVPTEEESKLLSDYYARQLTAYQADQKAAAALIAIGEAPQPKDLPPAELAAWTSVSRTLLNLYETINRN